MLTTTYYDLLPFKSSYSISRSLRRQLDLLGTRALMARTPVLRLATLVTIEHLLAARTTKMTRRHAATVCAAWSHTLFHYTFLNDLDIRVVIPKCSHHYSKVAGDHFSCVDWS